MLPQTRCKLQEIKAVVKLVKPCLVAANNNSHTLQAEKVEHYEDKFLCTIV